MKYYIWKIRKWFKDRLFLLKGRIRAVTCTITPGYLKRVEYEKLPIPIIWDDILDGRELEVEIGSGHGELLLANDENKTVRVGYEIRSRFYRLIKKKIRRRCDVFVFKGDAYESLMLHHQDDSLSRIYALFPDPWHKKRHNKRRPLKEEFFRLAAQKLKKGGEIFVATDWPDYQEFITKEVEKVKDIFDVTIGNYNNEKRGIPVTHYHQKWLKDGRNFVSFSLVKK